MKIKLVYDLALSASKIAINFALEFIRNDVVPLIANETVLFIKSL